MEACPTPKIGPQKHGKFAGPSICFRSVAMRRFEMLAGPLNDGPSVLPAAPSGGPADGHFLSQFATAEAQKNDELRRVARSSHMDQFSDRPRSFAS